MASTPIYGFPYFSPPPPRYIPSPPKVASPPPTPAAKPPRSSIPPPRPSTPPPSPSTKPPPRPSIPPPSPSTKPPPRPIGPKPPTPPAKPPSHSTPPPRPIAPPPSHIVPPPPAPSPSGGNTTIIIVFVSLGGLFFLAFLSIALCGFIKKRKKVVKEAEIISIDEHKKIQENIVADPNGTQRVVRTVEEDVHIQEAIKKDERVGEGLHAKAMDGDGSLSVKPTETGESSAAGSNLRGLTQHKP